MGTVRNQTGAAGWSLKFALVGNLCRILACDELRIGLRRWVRARREGGVLGCRDPDLGGGAIGAVSEVGLGAFLEQEALRGGLAGGGGEM